MGSCLSSSESSYNYYYDNRQYESYHASRIENRIQQWPSTYEELRKRAEIYASKIENNRIQEQYVMNSEIKSPSAAPSTYEELKKQAKIELGYAGPRREITSEKLLKIRQVCACNLIHILYRGENLLDSWECAHLNKSDWRKSKFGKLCEDCRAIVTLGLHKEKFHRMYLDDDMNIHKNIEFRNSSRYCPSFRLYVL